MLFNNSFIVIALTKIQQQEFLLICTYCPPRDNIEHNLNIIQQWIEKYQHSNILIMGDFNAKSPVRGKRREDSRGTHLINFCINNDINIENSPELPQLLTVAEVKVG
ncbi:hypothetical protein CDAR_470171 [Caerostris darwini]|uniref:Endonuclease/exonuclease/phosphatase domain-containing protein n=1 Tax=Caerostris darwini TaxID=1538125 RepID=A0AAV4TQD9_9ARAC|nr:hypothetical protein CDAR_470171 [Caerostris darwini]